LTDRFVNPRLTIRRRLGASGLAKVAGAIGLLIPKLSGLAALVLALLMVGAVITNMTVLGDSSVLPLLLALAGLVLWLRRTRLRGP
jgi:putative oxidoreductase